MDPWVPRPCAVRWLRGGTRPVAGTRWHLKVSGKGKDRETWQLPWLPAEHPPALARSTCEARPLLPGWFVGRKKGWGAPSGPGHHGQWWWGKSCPIPCEGRHNTPDLQGELVLMFIFTGHNLGEESTSLARLPGTMGNPRPPKSVAAQPPQTGPSPLAETWARLRWV